MAERVLVCGSRAWGDRRLIHEVLRSFGPGTVVIHGGARGADKLAGIVAKALGFKVEVYPADWKKYGAAAGPIRNVQMIRDGKPTRVVAFFMSSCSCLGTQNMVNRARAAGLPVEEHEEPDHRAQLKVDL